MLPHWPRRTGLGDVIQDQLEAAALSSSAWASVQGQLNIEGADPLRVLASQKTFTDAFTSLIAPANGFGVDSSSALNAAGQITMIGQTALGAVNTVTGLIHDIETGSVPQIAQEFTGGLVALAVGAGAVSAGIGAAIVAGVGALLNVMQSAGLFGPTAGVQIQGCPNVTFNPAPTMMVGCIAGMCDPNIVHVKPGSNNWRSFPKRGNAADQGWFQQGGSFIQNWGNVNWASPYYGDTTRMIDTAFTNYNWVERGATPQPGQIPIYPLISGSAFLQGFASAWCANQEYALNGLKPQDDASALLHFLRIWNRAHSGPTMTMRQGGEGSYAESLVTAVLNADNTFASGDGGLLINVGPSVQTTAATPRSVVLTHAVNLTRATAPVAASSSGMSTGEKVAVGAALTGGAVLVGSAGYAMYTHQSFPGLWSGLWRKVKSLGRK